MALLHTLRSPAEEVSSHEHNPYNYVPTEYVAIIFIVLFSLSTLGHTAQSVWFRMYWLLPTACLCGILEVAGWSARFWSSFTPSAHSAFELQITTTILGPTPLIAANFIILGKIIHRLGPMYSRLSPKWYTILFCVCDVISLVVQGIGGAMASSASGRGEDPTPGGNVMLGGIVFQLITITIYAVCASEFYIRYLTDSPIRKSGAEPSIPGPVRGTTDMRLILMTAALLFNTTCLFIRAVYRTIELTDGWNGRIISTQVYFNVLDGAMVVLAIYTLNFAHPGLLLGRHIGSKR